MCIPVVFVAVELVVCRDVRVESGAAEEVACNFGLVCEVIPQLERETDICGAESTDKVVFESLDGAFRCIDTMIVWLDKLNGTVAGSDKFFDSGRGLIVGDVEGGSKSFLCEVVKDCAECCDDVVTLC